MTEQSCWSFPHPTVHSCGTVQQGPSCQLCQGLVARRLVNELVLIIQISLTLSPDSHLFYNQEKISNNN